MDIQKVRELINATINSNGKNEITGKTLNQALNAIVDLFEPNSDPDSGETDLDQSKALNLNGTWQQKWEVGTLESMGPDNWGTDAVISAQSDSNTYVVSPIFGSLGFYEGGRLEKLSEDVYVLRAGTHNLLGPTNEVTFDLQHSVYVPEYDITVNSEVLVARGDENGKVILNDWSYVTNYRLIKRK